MSEENTARSSGSLKINGERKKHQGTLVAGEKGAAFYLQKQQDPFVEWQYDQMVQMESVRVSETALEVTVVLQDATK